MTAFPPVGRFRYVQEGGDRPAGGFDFQAPLKRALDEGHPWMRLDAVDPLELARVPRGPTLVLGMGGSALGTRAALAMAALGGPPPHEVRVLDTVDPFTARREIAWATSVGASLMVVSKSGSTIEIKRLLEAALAAGLGADGRLTLICDPDPTDLDRMLGHEGRAYVRLSMPAEVGGRYSVFTAVGQAPLHAAGLAAGDLLQGASAELVALRASDEAALGRHLAPLRWRDAHAGTAQLIWCYSDVFLPWAAWLQQLDCESLGRARDGDPVGDLVTVLRGPADQHSVAQLLLEGPQHHRILYVDHGVPSSSFEGEGHGIDHLARLREIERVACREAMPAPSLELITGPPGLETLGALMFHGMLATVLWAAREGIDPYGQPAVEAIKRRIRAALDT